MRSLNVFVIIAFLAFLPGKSFGQCRDINVKSKITHTTNGLNNGSVELEINGNSGQELSINLFGPQKNNRLDLSESIITNLEKGNYIIVVSGRKEGNNLCPVAINVTIN
jgi:hypothetical protein